MAFKFKGGVHPDYRKSPEVPVTVMAPPSIIESFTLDAIYRVCIGGTPRL